MKRLLACLLLLALCGCAAQETAPVEETVPVFAPTDSDRVQLGLAVTAHLYKSMHATEAFAGRAQLELTAAAVLVDETGVIRQCVVDGVGAAVYFDQGGALLTAAGTEYPSKTVLGSRYGMHKASPLGTEWQEQARDFAAHCVGKTAAQLQTGDTVTSVTMATEDLLDAVLQAVENAAAVQDLRAGDTLELACRGVAPSGHSACEAVLGRAALRIAAAAFALRGGAVVAQEFDAVAAYVPFDAAGRLACDVSAANGSVLWRTGVTAEERALLWELCRRG